MTAAASTGQTGQHQWLGIVGPHPDLVTAGGVSLLALAAAPLLLSMPLWWPTTVGPLALMANLTAAWWQAGTYRWVTTGPAGIQIRRKRRWSRTVNGEAGAMPRMPIGPVAGRWCRCDLGGVRLWIHRSQFERIDRFDHDFRQRFAAR